MLLYGIAYSCSEEVLYSTDAGLLVEDIEMLRKHHCLVCNYWLIVILLCCDFSDVQMGSGIPFPDQITTSGCWQKGYHHCQRKDCRIARLSYVRVVKSERIVGYHE